MDRYRSQLVFVSKKSVTAALSINLQIGVGDIGRVTGFTLHGGQVNVSWRHILDRRCSPPSFFCYRWHGKRFAEHLYDWKKQYSTDDSNTGGKDAALVM